jgi:hypothetical protein
MSLVAKLITEKTSVEDWYLLRERIDMSPSYQRKPNLWSLEKQRLLIDTILNDYDIPKLYLANFAAGAKLENPRRKLYAVIDGKQRLEAIFRFLANEFDLSDKEEAPGVPERGLKGLRFSDLTYRYPKLAEKVRRYQLSVVAVIADTDADIHRMFVRLNFGVSVNAAERRNAKPGPVPVAIRQIVEHDFFTRCVRFSTKRGDDKNLAAKILMFEAQGGITDTKASRLDRFTDDNAVDDKWDDVLGLVSRVSEVLDRLSKVFLEKDILLSSSGQAPVYYWMARNQWSNEAANFRRFLDYFDEQVKKQYRGDAIGEGENGAQLAEYYRWTRTVNDRDSIEGRYLMLAQRWEQWKVKPSVESS